MKLVFVINLLLFFFYTNKTFSATAEVSFTDVDHEVKKYVFEEGKPFYKIEVKLKSITCGGSFIESKADTKMFKFSCASIIKNNKKEEIFVIRSINPCMGGLNILEAALSDLSDKKNSSEKEISFFITCTQK